MLHSCMFRFGCSAVHNVRVHIRSTESRMECLRFRFGEQQFSLHQFENECRNAKTSVRKANHAAERIESKNVYRKQGLNTDAFLHKLVETKEST